MKKNNRFKNFTFGAFLAMAGAGSLFYILNRNIPRIADDYPFSFIWDGKNHGNLTLGKKNYKRIKTLKDLAKSQASHYMTWSGRTIGEGLNQLVLMNDDKKLFDVLNTFVILSYIHQIVRSGTFNSRRKKITAKDVCLISAGFFLTTPHIAATTLWQTGAMNYSIPGLFQMMFLLPYLQKFCDPGIKKNKFIISALGILAGWSNEAGGGAAVLFSLLSTTKYFRNKKDSEWMIFGVISVLLGYAILMLAPGNFVRYKWEMEYSDVLPDDLDNPELIPAEYNFTPEMFRHHFKNAFLSVTIGELPMQLPVLFYFLQKGKMDIRTTVYLLLLEAASLSIPTILMLSPQFPKRAAFLSGPIMMTAASAALFNTEADNNRVMNLVKNLSYGGIIITAAVKSVAALLTYMELYDQTEKQIQIIKNTKEDATALIPGIILSPTLHNIAGDRTIDELTLRLICFEDNPEDPYNMAVAAYYGAGKVIAENDTEKNI